MPSSYNRTSLKKINHRLPWSLWCSCSLLKMTLPLKSNFFYMVILEVNQFPPRAAKIHNSIYNLADIVTPVPNPTFTNIHKLQQYQITCLGLALKEKQTKKQLKKHYYFRYLLLPFSKIISLSVLGYQMQQQPAMRKILGHTVLWHFFIPMTFLV